MAADFSVIHLEITEDGADDVWMDGVTGDLLRELRTRDLEVERVSLTPPLGAKSGMGFTLATIAVTAAGSPVIAELVGILRDWLRRGRERTVRLTYQGETIELSSATAEERSFIVEAWLREKGARDT